MSAATPRELEKIVARCLRKDPERRFQDAADVRVALQEIKEESESGKLTTASEAAPRPGSGGAPCQLLCVSQLLLSESGCGTLILREPLPVWSSPG